MNPSQLFWQRVRHNWQFQRQVTRLVIDWVIALYLLVPLFGIVLYQYITWWMAVPSWSRHLPFAFFAVLLGLFVQTGAVHSYLEEADQLFLIQCPAWIHTLRRSGLAYSLIVQGFLTALLVAWMEPLFVHRYRESVADSLLFFLFVGSYRAFGSLLRLHIELRLERWLRVLVKALWYVVSFLVFTTLVIKSAAHFGALLAEAAVFLILLMYSMRRRLLSPLRLLDEAEYETGQRLKFLSLLLSSSGNVQKKSNVTLHRPLVFARSNRLFRKRSVENILTETALKSFVRSMGSVASYLRFMVLGVGATALSPGWTKWLIVLLLGGLVSFYAKSHWKEVKGEEYVRWFPWTYQDLSGAGQKTVLILTYPMLLVEMLTAAVQTMPAWGIAASFPLAYGVAYLLSIFFGAV